jgi:hypothetical protein
LDSSDSDEKCYDDDEDDDDEEEEDNDDDSRSDKLKNRLRIVYFDLDHSSLNDENGDNIRERHSCIMFCYRRTEERYKKAKPASSSGLLALREKTATTIFNRHTSNNISIK